MNLNRFQIASVKRTAASVKKLMKDKSKIEAQIAELNSRLEGINGTIEIWETPIIAMTGGLTSTQVLEQLNAPEENENNEGCINECPSEINETASEEGNTESDNNPETL